VLPWRSLRARALGDREEGVRLALEEGELARRLGSDRARGTALCTAGALARGQRGQELLEQAVAALERTPAALEHARALLELGANLRRTRQRAAAREPLRRAFETATSVGAAPLAERARDELLRSGARPRRVALDGVDSLTPTERLIASLAAEGLSNKEIAAKLVVTTKTVEWHLGRVYSKLGVGGRRELDPAVLEPAETA
jgi:DNA-binding NarL/FixJ family response regulator